MALAQGVFMGGTMTDPLNVPLHLPATPQAVRHARTFAVSLSHGLNDDQVSDLELMVSELVTNAVQHSQGFALSTESEPVIAVYLYRTSAGVRVEVHDSDPAHPLQVDEPEVEGHGWGLRLVSHLSSAWGTRPASDGDGKAVWFEIDWPT